MAQVYTQQEINYLTAMEQQNYVEMTPSLIQKTLPYAHMVCDLRREGYSEDYVIDFSADSLVESRLAYGMTDEQFDYTVDTVGTSLYYASEVLCPDVR